MHKSYINMVRFGNVLDQSR